MDNTEILFKDFSLMPHEEVWNKMVRHLAEVKRCYETLRETLPMVHSSEKTEKAFSYPWLNYRFRDMIQGMIRCSEEFSDGLEKMKIKKEKRNAR
uniref:Uncharacterized protein n=1 Tax=viral metagenome TaxID=1070528 RepID=A0A6M3LF75_9ZZZZ